MSQPQYIVTAIAATAADALRASGGITYVADEHPGYPCRQCLCDAQIGEEVILVSHDPFEHDSPYRAASPIFLHLTSCTSCNDRQAPRSPTLPVQLTGRRLAVRAFDDTEMMLDAALIDGAELDVTIRSLLGNESVHHLHVHNAERGCWATRVDRVDRVDRSTT